MAPVCFADIVGNHSALHLPFAAARAQSVVQKRRDAFCRHLFSQLTNNQRQRYCALKVLKQSPFARRTLPVGHALAFAIQAFGAESAEVPADRVEDPAHSDVHLVDRPRLGIPEAAVDYHVAAVADRVPPDVVAVRRAVIL
jgi:hypothetical protein